MWNWNWNCGEVRCWQVREALGDHVFKKSGTLKFRMINSAQGSEGLDRICLITGGGGIWNTEQFQRLLHVRVFRAIFIYHGSMVGPCVSPTTPSENVFTA